MKERTQKQQEERFGIITKKIAEGNKDRLNTMLSPEPFACDVKNHTSKIRFKNQEWEKNQRGELHGGSIAAMFDTAMGMSVLAFSDQEDISTADLNVNFIRPFLGNAYVFEVEIVHLGRRIVRTTAKAYDEDTNKCLASATGNFVYINR